MARPSTIALATSPRYPDLTDEARLAADAVRGRGFDVAPLVWSDASARPRTPAAVAIRSTWDYHRSPRAFLAFLDEMDSRGAAVFNPPALVRWNAHKGYLLELAGRGIAIPPTRLVTRGARVALASLRAELAADVLVVKPAVSASAEGLWRTAGSPSHGEEARLRAEAEQQDLLVQAYLPEIATQGEWSLVFFAGAYSHAVLKAPAPGEFRTQRDFGGTARAAEPPEDVRAQGSRVLAALGSAPLYARVDVSAAGGYLMELELIEPELFFRLHPPAAAAFAGALAAALAERR